MISTSWRTTVTPGGAGAPGPPLLLARGGVRGPPNAGLGWPTGAACGAPAVSVARGRAARVTPAVRKVAVGAAETTPVVAVTNLVRTLKLLKQAGLWVVG